MNLEDVSIDTFKKSLLKFYADFYDSYKKELNNIDIDWLSDKEGLEDLNSRYDYVSFIDASIMIGSRVNPVFPDCLVSQWKIFADAILTQIIDPRHPLTYIPYSKNTKHFVSPGKAEKEEIDYSWKMSRAEVARLATYLGYDLELFSDLLSDASPDAPEETIKDQKQDKPLDTREKNTLLTIIYALCEKQSVKPDQRGLAKELEIISDTLGQKVSERTIKEHLKKASELLG